MERDQLRKEATSEETSPKLLRRLAQLYIAAATEAMELLSRTEKSG